ncbi:hypothetical protein O7602_01405 [Micromonospora sp. WMMD1128]|uniref:hypothetical protein n=1 Tax=Micromonospora sp. WMMD1128 TaxID=3015150 RepID=UPI00248CDCF3|nr:hypothetical protein [Micromonospora sp. WMMD1128]WBB74250.1 hypothetical protein O7602_01405 [Micromonospora sp. WMMD1128]
MTQSKTNRIPAPLYAAAGAGELALEQLRKLPTVVSGLGTRVVTDLGGKAVGTGYELRQKADLDQLREAANLEKLREAANLDKLREAATRNAAAVVSGAYVAQQRALAAYAELVARGERVVGAGVLEAADTVNADIAATEETVPAAVAPKADAPKTEAPSPTEVAEAVAAKPAAVKRTRATKATTARAAAAKPVTPKATKRTRPAAE